jgi:hypothetical protein
LRNRLSEAGIRIGAAKGATEANLTIDEAMNRRAAEKIARAFLNAAG